jgi:hypothetical protein
MITTDKNGFLVIHTPFKADAKNTVIRSLLESLKLAVTSKEQTDNTPNALCFLLDLIGCMIPNGNETK